MEHDPKKVVKIKVTDKRGVAEPSPTDHASTSASPPDQGETSDTGFRPDGAVHHGGRVSDISADGPTGDTEAPAQDARESFLDDLRRLQADFDNYRKRMMRESAEAADRATARVIEELLPVLDNFERAIAHGEGGEGVQLVFKDLAAALERLGLSEVPAEGAAFDPNLHEAVESRETDGLEESTILEVYRRGYLHKDRLLRPAMVVVGRPAEKDE